MASVDINLDELTPKQLANLKKKLDVKDGMNRSICPSSVKITSRPAVNKYLEEGKRSVYEVITKKDDGKTETAYYTSCTRTINGGKKYCYKHNDVFEKNPEKISDFEDIISNAKRLEKKDTLDVKVKETRKTTDTNPDPIIAITMTKEIKKMFANVMKQMASEDNILPSDTKNSSSSEEEVEADAEPEVESEKDSSDDASSESEKEKSDDDETDAIPITTKDGRELGLEQDTELVYDVDSDGNGTELGKLTSVSDDSAPIEYQGSNCIVAVELNDGGIDYLRCAVSNKLYKKGSKSIVKVGKVNKIKTGGYKVILDSPTVKSSKKK